MSNRLTAKGQPPHLSDLTVREVGLSQRKFLMEDGELIKQISQIMSVRWCGHCKEQYVYYDGWEKYANLKFKRKCCTWRIAKEKNIKKNPIALKPWPPMKDLEEIYGTPSDNLEAYDDFYKRINKNEK
jgi:hypothetical protein